MVTTIQWDCMRISMQFTRRVDTEEAVQIGHEFWDCPRVARDSRPLNAVKFRVFGEYWRRAHQ